MKIKKINLYGFKSFPAETDIILNAGITAFVGPNGSGKSNIFDALRWVFGEQSMKALRCERIEDLIYISPESKEDANFTEVSVTIDNEDYFPQFGGEFEIKRRFYRSGESEFFLNRVKCRLQDIQALFLNSGTLSYSFLELSEIEKIIHGDTKQMFDDVSGILKYQERREQTKRRLEATEQDFLRLEDIIHEMRRSLRSLKRQVRQTRLFQELRDEYKEISLTLLKNQYDKQLKCVDDMQKQIDTKERERQEVFQEIKNLQGEREKIKSEMSKIEETKQETMEKIKSIVEQIEQLSQRVTEREEEAKQIILSNERTITSIHEKEELGDNLRARITQMKDSANELENKVEEMKISIEKAQQDIDEKNGVYFELKEKIDEFSHRQRVYADKREQINQDIAKIQLEQDNISTLIARVEEEYYTRKEDCDRFHREMNKLNSETESIVEQQDQLSKSLQDEKEKIVQLEKNYSDLDQDLNSRQEVLADLKLTIDTLQHRLKEKGSIKEIREHFKNKEKGLVRDNIKVEQGYESVVDICLGDLLNYYLLGECSGQDFKSLPDGRFGFVNLSAERESLSDIEKISDVIPITNFVKFSSFENVISAYINTYFLVRDFNQAYQLSNKYPTYGFVVKDGILLKNGKIIIEHGEIGFFKIRQTLEKNQQELERVKNEVIFINKEQDRLRGEIEQHNIAMDKKRNKLFSVNIKKSEVSLKLNQVTRSHEKVQRECDNLSEDKRKLEKKVDDLKIKGEECKKRVYQVKTEISNNESELNNMIKEHEKIDEENKKHMSELNEQRIEMVALEERLNSLRNGIKDREHEIDNLTKEISVLKEGSIAKRLSDVEADIKSLKDKLADREKEKHDSEEALPEKKIEHLTQRLNAIFDDLSNKQNTHEDIQNTIMQLKYDAFEAKHSKEEAYKKAREEFKVDLQDYKIEEEKANLEERLAEVKGKLERLGEVNPLSLELYEREKKRLDDFLAQRDDIIAARKNLLGSIEELDNRARERFITTFNDVKKEFNFVFSNFFEGGHADLVLSDSSNPLTSKVNIVVRMKGKRLKIINQLSGGERTLLAISLLLAFYLVKPAPFCILDEIDAPLDDANVVRFNKFLRDLSQRTQVVIITHNRATMEYADYLYGLTMERPGQSKIISAKLADLEKIELNA